MHYENESAHKYRKTCVCLCAWVCVCVCVCVCVWVTDVLTSRDLCLKHCLLTIMSAANLSFTHNAMILIGSPWLAMLLINGVHGTLYRAQERLDLIGWFLQQETGHKLLNVGSSLINLGRSEGKKKQFCMLFIKPQSELNASHSFKTVIIQKTVCWSLCSIKKWKR